MHGAVAPGDDLCTVLWPLGHQAAQIEYKYFCVIWSLGKIVYDSSTSWPTYSISVMFRKIH